MKRGSVFLAVAFFLSGASALIYELMWFRLLGHIFGSTATATATLLAAYLFGLGLGAWIMGRLSDRIRALSRVYVAIEVGIGLFGIASRWLMERGGRTEEEKNDRRDRGILFGSGLVGGEGLMGVAVAGLVFWRNYPPDPAREVLPPPGQMGYAWASHLTVDLCALAVFGMLVYFFARRCRKA